MSHLEVSIVKNDQGIQMKDLSTTGRTAFSDQSLKRIKQFD